MPTRSLKGEISNLKAVNLAGLKRSRLVAKVDAGKRGIATVILGPKAALSGWDLQRGDQIEVEGVRARLNDRDVLMAARVSHDGQSKKIDLPERRNMKRVKATVRSTREVRFRRFDQPFVIGQVETKSGDREIVNFGPTSKVGELDLQEGDEVRLLVRQGRMNGRPVMVAKEIRSGGDRVKITHVKAKRADRGQDKRQEDRPASRGRDEDASAEGR